MLPDSNIYRLMNNILRQGVAEDIYAYNRYASETQNLERIKYDIVYRFDSDCKWIFVPFRIPLIRENFKKKVYKKIF